MPNSAPRNRPRRRPVVASAVGGVTEMVEHERTGLLVSPHDPVALGNAISRVLTGHPLADMLARAAHEMVQQSFSVTANGQRGRRDL